MSVKVTIRGVDYPSQRAAAEALGVSHQAIAKARMLGTLDRVGTGAGRFSEPYLGYPSKGAAAEALGVSKSAISQHCLVERNLKEIKDGKA